MKELLLLHVCCAPCAIYPISILKDKFNLTLLFYGPNIYPKEEYTKRLNTLKQITNIPLIESDYNPNEWYTQVEGLENEKEGGKRCSICYEMRLSHTARFAKENGFKYFATTLTVSPHKPAGTINALGLSIAKRNGLIFLAEDFKKKDGFKKSCELSKEHGLYRQRYCGCEYSKNIL